MAKGSGSGKWRDAQRDAGSKFYICMYVCIYVYTYIEIYWICKAILTDRIQAERERVSFGYNDGILYTYKYALRPTI